MWFRLWHRPMHQVACQIRWQRLLHKLILLIDYVQNSVVNRYAAANGLLWTWSAPSRQNHSPVVMKWLLFRLDWFKNFKTSYLDCHRNAGEIFSTNASYCDALKCNPLLSVLMVRIWSCHLCDLFMEVSSKLDWMAVKIFDTQTHGHKYFNNIIRA